MDGTNKAEGGGKARLLSLGALDGRTTAARNARALITGLEGDLGGADRLTAAEREIVQRAAVAGAMLAHMEAAWLAGRGVDVAEFTALANLQRRMLVTVGLQRRSRDVTPDLQRYIQQRAEPAGEDDGEDAP